MKKISIGRTAALMTMLFIFSLILASSHLFAQTPGDAPQGEPPRANQEANWREQLGLTPEQMGKIRSIREANAIEGQTIRRRVNLAQRALDQAIYSDTVNEADVEQRARELVAAQAAEVRLRAMTELNIRRVLTPEQLGTFRMIRQQRLREAQMRRRLENGNDQAPLRNQRLENGLNPPPPRDGNRDGQKGAGQRQENINRTLAPRIRRGALPRRIRP